MRYVCWWSDWTLAKRHKLRLGWKIYAVNAKSIWHRMLNHFYRHVCRPSAMDISSTPMRFDWCTALANSWACCHMKMYCDGWMSLCHHASLNYNLLYKTNRYELKLLLTLQCYLNRFLNILKQLNDASKIRTTFRLNMISTLFSSLNTRVKSMEDDAAVQNPEAREQPVTQPVLLIMQKTMPIFKDIATLWINETSVIEVWSLILGENHFQIIFVLIEQHYYLIVLGTLLRFKICHYKFTRWFYSDVTRSMHADCRYSEFEMRCTSHWYREIGKSNWHQTPK